MGVVMISALVAAIEHAAHPYREYCSLLLDMLLGVETLWLLAIRIAISCGVSPLL